MKNSKPDDGVILFPGVTPPQIEDAATQRVVRCHSGESTLGDIVETAMWRAESPAHNRVYREIDRLWRSMGALSPPASKLSVTLRRLGFAAGPGLSRQLGKGDGVPGQRLAALAAAIAAVALFGTYMTTWRYDYHTAPGQIKTVVLADGSTASLKGDTALSVRFTENGERVVNLARGEAFFEVVHSRARPFIVEAGAAHVLDVGTGFAVARHGQSGSVSVDHGEVDLIAAGGERRLEKEEGAAFSVYELGRKVYVDTQRTTAWRRGLYFAEAKPLGEVIADVNPYLKGKILLVSDDLRMRPINAVVQLAKVDAWLSVLGNVHGVSVKKIGPLIIIGKQS